MPPKKYNIRNRGSRNGQTSISDRSTASIFLENNERRNETIRETSEEITEVSEKEVSEAANQAEISKSGAQEQGILEDDDPSNYSFPLNYVFLLQDFLNETMTFSKFVQILIQCYLIEIIYFNIDKLNLSNEFPIMMFNLLGVFIGSILSYTSQLSKFKQGSGKFQKPQLPEFNHIYSILLPLYLNVVHKSGFFLIAISLNYCIIENLNPLFKYFLCLMFFHIYNDEQDPQYSTYNFLQVLVVYYLLNYLIEYLNQDSPETVTDIPEEVIDQDEPVQNLTKNHNTPSNCSTLNKSEIQLLNMMLVNLLFNLNGLSQNNLPLFIIQKLLISLLVSLMIVYPFYKYYEAKSNTLISILITALFSASFYLLTNYQLKLILNNDNSIVWLYNFIMESRMRINLLVYWITSLAIIIPIIFSISSSLSLNVRRKIWHLILLILIIPKLISETQFILISLLGSILIFLIIEIIRFNKFTFAGIWLHDSLIKFQDFKDLKGPLNLSYIYLILGVTLPIIVDYCSNERVTIKAFIGLISLGVGDSLASIIGKKYGTIKWKGSTKSVQGTLVFILSSLTCFFLIDRYLLLNSVKNWENIFICVLLSGILEGVCDLNDNFLIPIFMLATSEILEKAFY